MQEVVPDRYRPRGGAGLAPLRVPLRRTALPSFGQCDQHLISTRKNSLSLRPIKTMATRKYVGVQLLSSGRFQARSRDDATGREYIGTFDTAEEAARAYDARAVQLGGARRKLNFPHENAAGGSSQQQAPTSAGGNPKSMYTGVCWSRKRGCGRPG
jgi:hypothetical protein